MNLGNKRTRDNQLKIIFMLRNGAIEWEVPENLNPPFSFGVMATQVHMTGYFMSDNLYVRRDELVGISIAGEAGPIVRPRLDS